MMEILLEVQHLTIAYPQNREVVRELNLCLKKGERLGIVGESGTGKTTLAMALAGINNQEQTRSGTVTFYGKQRGIILQNAMTCLEDQGSAERGAVQKQKLFEERGIQAGGRIIGRSGDFSGKTIHGELSVYVLGRNAAEDQSCYGTCGGSGSADCR